MHARPDLQIVDDVYNDVHLWSPNFVPYEHTTLYTYVWNSIHTAHAYMQMVLVTAG